jgi:hypothetical protein
MTSAPLKFLDPTDEEFFVMYCHEENCDVSSLSSVLSSMRKLCSDFHYAVRKNLQLQKIVDQAGIPVPTVSTAPWVAGSAYSTSSEEPEKKNAFVSTTKPPDIVSTTPTDDFLDYDSYSDQSVNLLETPKKKERQFRR